MPAIPTDPDKVERMKKRMAKESAAQAAQKYRERAEYNEKARVRMAQKRQTLTEDQVAKRQEAARKWYERNRIFILEKAKKKRIQDHIDRNRTEGYKETYPARQVVPAHLLSLRKRDPAQFDTEKFKWKKKLLTDQYFARKRAKTSQTRN
ncbi:hypothetical protein V5O48_009386 [Marasmius crinis-equi]|uniref:Uncharacterized protein n=1 Tax=Marasmius crinis-equi TaxID=585013 RepID=A0ABR3FB81_9AGAR